MGKKADPGTIGARLTIPKDHTTCSVCNRSMLKSGVDTVGRCPDCAETLDIVVAARAQGDGGY